MPENVNFPRFLNAVDDTSEPRNEGVVSEEEGATSIKLTGVYYVSSLH